MPAVADLRPLDDAVQGPAASGQSVGAEALWTLGPWRIEIADWRPSIAAALAPPRFRLLRQT